MTAEITIMNKSAIALAADSASTSYGGKIFNSTNKLFMLSNHHPVGIMIYQNAEFMDYSWELIIKEFRNVLGRKAFPTIKDYLEAFIHFIQDGTKIFESTAEKQRLQEKHISMHLNRLYECVLQELRANFFKIEQSKWNESTSEYLQRLLIDYNSRNISVGFRESDFETILEKYSKIIDDTLRSVFGTTFIYDDFHKILLEISIQMLVKPSNASYTGVVIAGFGDSQKFPAVSEIKISQLILDKLVYFTGLELKMDSEKLGFILPFATPDIINTLLYGVNPNLESLVNSQVDMLKKTCVQKLDEFAKQGLISIGSETVNQIDTLFQEAISKSKEFISNEVTRTILRPFLMGVAVAPINELAIMAETLINLTNFKQRFSSNDIETVGGPIDVAVISKYDGFVWIKRKHYFEQSYNSHFLLRKEEQHHGRNNFQSDNKYTKKARST